MPARQTKPTAVAGLGLGPAFSGVMRSLGPLAPLEKRGALFAAHYIVIYFAISVPAIAAGVAASHYGLRDTTNVFGLVVMALAAIATLAVSRRRQPIIAWQPVVRDVIASSGGNRSR